MMLVRLSMLMVMAALGLGACGGSGPDNLPGIATAAGLEISIEHTDILGPTQLVVVDDAFFVAAINGGENDEVGQVLRVDRSTGGTDVLVDSLDKPTGLALANGELWIMERDRLTRRSLEENSAGEPTVVAEDLPNNGRSEGTLTVTPDGLLMFDTSGSKRGADVVAGSGRLFTVDPAERPGTPVEIASGFKHAYAHAFDDDVLWTTEMTDGQFDGVAAGDEIVAVLRGADHGWPRCVENNRPVSEFGGSADECSATPPSLAIFDPGASPTSVVVSPFEPETLLVALWNEGRVVAVNTASSDPSEYTDVVTGLIGPQHLAVTEDAVYLTEFGQNRILKLTRP